MMDNSIKTFFSFLLSKDQKIGTKLFFASLILIIVVLINNLFGFSFYYNTEKKISQVKEISKILENENLENDVRNELVRTRKEILERESVFDYLLSLKTNKQTNKNKADYLSSKSHSVYNFLSSSWYFILIVIGFLIKTIREKKFDLTDLIVSLFFGLILFGAGLALSFFTNLIPIIYSKAIWLNYILNVIIVFILFFRLIMLDFENIFGK